MDFSANDLALLREIQRDSGRKLGEIAEAADLPQSTAWRRVDTLEKAGVIRARVGLLDPKSLNCALLVLASVALKDHSESSLAGFARLIEARPEIMECFAVSGAADYMLKVRVADVEAYDRFMTTVLLRSDVVQSVQSNFVLRELKSTTELPL